jgi:hypothetical protein
MFGFLKGMKSDYPVILTASYNKAIFVLNLSKIQRILPLTTQNDCFFKSYEK